jgi:two-component system chemotaxis response regulator CheB
MTEGLARYDDIEVVGSAIDPYMARDKIVELHPDVITLDLEMPRMDGLSFLSKIMKHFPLPVVVVSSLTPENSATALRALELGAVEVIAKPGSTFSTPDIDRQLVRAVRSAASANVTKRVDTANQSTANQSVKLLVETTHKIIAIGASTGGTQAIEVVLKSMPVNAPGIVIVQHMPEHFTGPFAERLNRVCQMEVREARDGDAVVTGLALIAPGNKHMVLQQSGAKYFARIKDGPVVHHQRPAVDVLFQTVATSAGKNAVGVLLTGMGADGAKGLLAMKQAGAHTIVQDENTSVVFGMPKEAIKLGAACEIQPLQLIASRALSNLQQKVA